MHKQVTIAIGESTSIEPEKTAISGAYVIMLNRIFNRPQKHFFLKGGNDTLIPRVMVLTPVGWKVVPADVADYPQFVTDYLD